MWRAENILTIMIKKNCPCSLVDFFEYRASSLLRAELFGARDCGSAVYGGSVGLADLGVLQGKGRSSVMRVAAECPEHVRHKGRRAGGAGVWVAISLSAKLNCQ